MRYKHNKNGYALIISPTTRVPIVCFLHPRISYPVFLLNIWCNTTDINRSQAYGEAHQKHESTVT